MKKPKKKSTLNPPPSPENLSWMDKIRAAGDRAIAATAKELKASRKKETGD